MRHIKKRSKVNLQFNRDIPDVEWWDLPLLGDKTYLQSLNLPEEATFEEKLKAISTTKW